MKQKETKRKGKAETIIDAIDYEILRMLSIHKRLTITALRNIIRLTHSNLTTHLKRLIHIIDRKRAKQTIYISLNRGGKMVLKILDDYFPSMKMKVKAKQLDMSFGKE